MEAEQKSQEDLSLYFNLGQASFSVPPSLPQISTPNFLPLYFTHDL